MKKFIYFIVGTFLLSATACQNELLDQKPLDQISAESVFADLNLTQLFANSIYNGLPNGFNRGWYMLDAGSDDAENSYGWPDIQAFNRGDYTPSSYPQSGTWSNNYSSIRQTNILLEKIDNVPGDVVKKQQLKGEAKFLRAYFYFELVKSYGAVPLIVKSLTITDDLQLPRNSLAECVSFVVKECDEAAALLPLSFSGSDIGRATKGAALALKSRMLLYAASPLLNTAKWADAAQAAKAVMALNTYSLYPDYGKLFLTDNNVEVIFDKQFDASRTSDIFNPAANTINVFDEPLGYGGWGGTGPTQDFVDAYEITDGKTIKDSPLYTEADPYKNRDARFYSTVFYEGSIWAGRAVETRVGGLDGMEKNGDATKTGYYLRKFLEESLANVVYSRTGSVNWILLRYAETLLNYAEAQNEAVGPDASVYDAVNQIRARAKQPNLPTGLTQSQMRDRIRNERRIELAFEEHRFWDIRRWKIAEKVLNGPANAVRITKDGNKLNYSRFVFETRKFDPAKQYLLPIPQSEIDKNKNLQQNPGW